ncbi:hypothetical protein Ddye_013120 [Dipteronia dyeriana]|uniref:DUF4218 domain-containing protein n=1 Tax=Dipteronia dyeriana TaxID=168575 RepID=A0AAD9X5P7_9ROSI|nr:hypothetical protein Ddye_013120 [Dipteronia dyeriana]
MHIEKNVCDNVLGTIFNIDGQSKDSLNARFDLQSMGIRNELHHVNIDGKITLPATCYTLTNDDKKNIANIPSRFFFDIMIHLPIHLDWEAKVVEPVQYMWMYLVEMCLRKLKGYVRNKARPEGSIAKGYLADECVTFCSRYMDGVETKFNKSERNYDDSNNEAPPSNAEPKVVQGSSGGKRKGRGKAKDVTLGHGLEEKSAINKNIRDDVDMHHTAGSVPIAKYKSEEMEKIRKEPCPIECFKKFHVRKNSKAWTNEKAKELYVCIVFLQIRNFLIFCKILVNEWDIYREIVGEPSHGNQFTK